MRVKKYLALTLAALFAATMLTGCPWDIEDDEASDSSSAPSSSSRPSHDSSDDDSGSAPSSPSTPDDEASENPGDEESEKPTPTEIIEKYGDISDDGTTLTITNTEGLGFSNESFRNALNKASDITTISFGTGVKFIPDDAFKDCTNLTNVELDDVTEIGSNAFQGCSSLISIDLGSVTSIGSHAFDSCTNLASIDLSNVETIDVDAFSGCTKLTSIDLSNVETIDANVFSGCTNLAHIRLGEGNQDGVDPNAFNGIAKTVHVYYGTSKEEAQAKWEELDLTMASGTQVEYHSANDWEKRENDDNAAEALPDAMKGLLALTERLG